MMADILDIPTLYIKFKFLTRCWSFVISNIPVEGKKSTEVLSGTPVALSVLHIHYLLSAKVNSSTSGLKTFFSG